MRLVSCFPSRSQCSVYSVVISYKVVRRFGDLRLVGERREAHAAAMAGLLRVF